LPRAREGGRGSGDLSEGEDLCNERTEEKKRMIKRWHKRGKEKQVQIHLRTTEGANIHPACSELLGLHVDEKKGGEDRPNWNCQMKWTKKKPPKEW